MILKKAFVSRSITQFLEKQWRVWENTEMLNLKQQKKEEIIKYQNQIIILQRFSQEVY